MATRPKVKVRTGCLTCKARKVKCDESRPACWRCISSRRQCSGYADVSSSSRALPRSSMQPQTSPAKEFISRDGFDKSLSSPLPADEHRWLQFFSSHAGPGLSGYPDSRSFWSVELPQLSVSEPAVRHALLALSSRYAHFESQLGSAKQLEQIVGQGFTINHYSRAISSLRQGLHSKGSELHVPLICCLLFICLECLHGNNALTITHLRNGLRILDLAQFRDGNSTTLNSLRVQLTSIFTKLGAQSTLFGGSTSPSNGSRVSMDFADAFTARAALDTLISKCMVFAKVARIDYGDPVCSENDPKRQTQTFLLDQLRAWEARMQSLQQCDNPPVDSNASEVIMLHVRQQATLIYVALSLDPHQTFCDAFLPQFDALLCQVERFMACSNKGWSHAMLSLQCSAFSLESAMIPTLWLTAIKCRDPVTRRRAIGLLETHRGREGLWDATLHAKAAKRVVAIEEADVSQQQVFSSPQWPDERSRLYQVDVRRISEDPCRSAQVTFHKAPHGYFGNKVIWSEDIIF